MGFDIRPQRAAEERGNADGERGEARDEPRETGTAEVGQVRYRWIEGRGHARRLHASRAGRIGRSLHFLRDQGETAIGKVPYEPGWADVAAAQTRPRRTAWAAAAARVATPNLARMLET